MAKRSRSDKLAMHQGFPIININLAMLAPWVWPDLAVIDGFEAMEGTGPSDGTPVNWHIALAGTDALAVDVLTSSLMGFEPLQIGYLHYCHQLKLGTGDMARISVVGNVECDAVRRNFRPHPTFHLQSEWHLETADSLLRKAPKVSEN